MIGRTTDESSPAWPAPVRGRRATPERAVRRAGRHGFRPARLLRQPDRDAELRRARRRAACASPTCTPRRCARRAARASSPGATTTATAWPHHRAGHRLPRLQRRHPVRERHALGDAGRARLQHVHGRQVAPDPEQPGDGRRPLRPLAARPRLRALLRLPRRRHEPVVSRPRLRQPPGRAAARRRRRATTSPRTWSTGRSSSSPTPSRSTPTSRSTCTSASGPRTRRTTCRRSGPTSTPALFDDGWDAYREKVFARQKELGIVPADAELSRHDPDVPDWELAAPGGAQAVQPDDGGVRRLPQPHRPPPRPAARLPARAQGELDNTIVMVISDNGASAEGGPTGHHERGAVLQQRPGAARGQPRGDRRDRRPEALQPLPVGLDLGGQHAVPALEARDLPRRRLRPVHRLLAGRASRPRARSATSTRTSSTWCRRCSTCSASSRPPTIRGVTQSPLHGVSFAHALDDAARRASTTRSTSRCSATAPSTTTAGGRSARGPARRSPRRASASASRSRRRRSRRSTPSGWELYHVAEDFAENHDVAAEHRDRLIALIATWYVEAGKYDVHADRRQRAGPHDRREAARGRCRATATSTGRTPSRSRSSPARGCSTGRTASPPTSTSPTAAPRACCSARAPRPAATRSTSRTAGCTTSTTTSAGRCTRVASDAADPARRARAALRVRADRRARHGRTAGARPAGCSSTSTEPWSANAEAPVDHAVRPQPRRAHLRRQPRLAGHPRLHEPVPVHRHPAQGRQSTSAAS